MWNGTMLFLHVFYVQSWIVSLATYIVVYLEMLLVIFFTFGGNIIGDSVMGAIGNCAYYVILFAAFAFLSVLAFRTYEMRERSSFFAELHSRHKMEGWKALLDDLPEPVILAQSGGVTFYNNATEKFFKCSKQKFDEADFSASLERVKQSDGKSLKDIITSQAMALPEASSSSFVYTDGKKQFKLFIKCVEIKMRNATCVVEYIVHDVTALEDLEQEKAQRRCLQMLVATVSHDIRTPINAIQGVHDVLAPYLTSSELQEQLKIAQIAVKRMLLYVRGLAFLEHLENKSLQLDYSGFDVAHSVHEILEYFDPSLKSKGIAVSVQCQSTLSLVVSDREKYETIIYHLIENAVKYTMKGRIDIRISFSTEENMLVTQIKDTGIGIEPSQHSSLFKLFLDKSDKCELNPQGIGLGLYMASSLARVLGGQISLNSTRNVGTTVTFSIRQAPTPADASDPMTETEVMLLDSVSERREAFGPLPSMPTAPGKMMSCWSTAVIEEEKRPRENDPDSPTKRSVLSYPPSHCECGCNRVLLVDDEAMNNIVFKHFLGTLKLEADTAQNGKQALELILARRKACEVCKGYRVIFMDINMPVMNGIEATKEITELIRDRTIPNAYLVAVTAAAHLEDREVYNAYKRMGFATIRKNAGVTEDSAEASFEEHLCQHAPAAPSVVKFCTRKLSSWQGC
ncbi:MAG: hybrid sensor histidine kinase/response regulator [Candidatus Pacebacteria bacterium]|nr:hybrid sensor histidine kinase/response regulator [Candidatus Paceibacterota bacterium]